MRGYKSFDGTPHPGDLRHRVEIGYTENVINENGYPAPEDVVLCKVWASAVDAGNQHYHRLEPDDIMRRFADWREKGQYTPHGVCFDCGGTCGAAISRYLRGLRAKDCGGTGERDNGNGSLMRILPLLFFLRSEYGVLGKKERLL